MNIFEKYFRYLKRDCGEAIPFEDYSPESVAVVLTNVLQTKYLNASEKSMFGYWFEVVTDCKEMSDELEVALIQFTKTGAYDGKLFSSDKYQELTHFAFNLDMTDYSDCLLTAFEIDEIKLNLCYVGDIKDITNF